MLYDNDFTGSAVAQYPTAADPLVTQHTIELGVTGINSVPMSAACRDQYRLALTADLVELSRLINERICNGSMCPYMSGAPGSGVLVNQSTFLTNVTNHGVFVAIDTASLTNAISFDVSTSTVRTRCLDQENEISPAILYNDTVTLVGR